MRPLRILHIILYTIVICFFSETALGQKIYNLDGTSIAVGTPVNVCPNVDYTLNFSRTSGSANPMFFQATGTNSGNVQFNGSAGTTATCLASPGNLTIRFVGTGSSYTATITVRNDASGNCTGSGGTETLTFSVQTGAINSLPATYNACYGSPLELANTCAGDCGAATFAWTQNGASVGGNTEDHTMGISTINGIGVGNTATMQVTSSVSYASGALVCTSVASTDVTVRDIPSLSAMTFGAATHPNPYTAATNGEICINGDQAISITCTGDCPTVTPSVTGTYEWFIRESSVSGLPIVANGTTILSAGSHSATANGSDGETIVPATIGTVGVAPGLYDIVVVATNDYGCSSTFEQEDDFTVNDIPAVEIYHNKGDATWNIASMSSVDVAIADAICTGVNLEFEVNGCADSDYITTNMSQNSSGAVSNPNAATNYTTPCLTNTNGSYFRTVTWTALGEDGVTPIPIDGTTTATTLSIPTDDASNRVSSSASWLGVVAPINRSNYSVTVEGYNGCTNSDDIIIRVEEPVISFEIDGTPVAAHVDVTACYGSTPQILAVCDLCQGTTSATWAATQGSNTIQTGTDTLNPMTVNPVVASASTSWFEVTVTGERGCTNSQTLDDAHIVAVAGPVVSVSNQALICSSGNLELTDAGFSNSSSYAVYTSDPNIGNPAAVYNCAAGSCSNPILVPNPTDGTTYWLEATNGSCADDDNTGAINVEPSPSISIKSDPSPPCNNRINYYHINGSSSYNYVWTIDTPNAASTTAQPNPLGQGIISSGFFFGTSIYYQLNNGISAQTGVELGVTATASNGCTATLDFPPFDILDCTDPVMRKSKNGQPPNGLLTYDYICEGESIEMEAFFATTPPYTALYAWSTGETTADISVLSYPGSPDTITRSVTIYKDLGGGNTDSITTLTTTTIVSRGNVNFYPTGDNDPLVVDTSICINGGIIARANCPTCVGNLAYEWDLGAAITATNGSDWQTHTVNPSTTTTFDLLLTVSHGEDCEEDFVRTIDVNPLPGPILRDVDGNTLAGTKYLCDGEIDTIYVECGTCSTYRWNTSANTDTIFITNQGGYYAEVVDGNSCTNISNIAVYIESIDGLNSPVVANPTQVCSGRDVVLEVAPCVGCSYTWFNTAPLPNGTPLVTTQTHTTTVNGDYFAVVENQHGCLYKTNQINVNSTTLTIPTISGTTDSICTGQSTTLSTGSLSNVSYQWYLNGTVISGAIDSVYTTTVAGTYTVQVVYPNGCIEESPSFLVSSLTFTPNIVAADTVVCSGATVDLTTDLYAGWQYQWYRNGILIPGAIGSAYSADSAGSYYVEVTNYHLCVEQTTALDIISPSLSKPHATTNTPSICPNEYGVLSVSLCSECSYQWFEFDGTTSTAITNVDPTNYRDSVLAVSTSSYYAEVSKDGCSELSDTISIVVNSVFTPAITSSSSVVCDGRDALLITTGCIGCSYSWLINGSPVLGALNDTFHLVDNINDIGDYQIAVDYPNGCADTSAILTISDGSYSVLLEIDTTGGVPLDSVICNGVGETLLATPSITNLPGTYYHTLFLNNSPATGQSGVASSGASHTFPGNDAGVYTVEVTNPLNCRAISNLLPLRAVDILPVLTARATADPTSVGASAICTDSGTVFMEVTVPNCVTCTYDWRRGSASIGNTTTTYTTPEGAGGTGLYIVNVTEDGCLASSNVVGIANSIGTLNAAANTTDTSICNGQSVTLEHAASLGSPSANCIGCSFRWLRNTNPINGASNFQYVTSTPGIYNLEVTTSNGCVDTSTIINIRQVDPPSGMMLNFDTLVMIGTQLATGTPLASNGDPIDMNNWIFPSSARNDSLGANASSYFGSAPYNGALPVNAGLAGTDSVWFQPNDTLAGYHLITYYYDTLGCIFTVDDILEVLPPAAITVTNSNPLSVPYEACVGDDLTITTVNLDYSIDQVYAFDSDDNYVILPLNTVTTDPDTFGTNIRWNTTINLTVPGIANASYLMLVNSTTNDTTFTPFVLIHNTDLSFTGLPNMLCSNGAGITLFGNPSGGSFYVTTAGVPNGTIPNVVVGDTLYPTLLNQAAYTNGNQWVDVYYSYIETYTNGNQCPSNDTVSIRKEVKDVRLTDVTFNTISVSQTEELLTNLVHQVVPYQARPNKQPLYTSSFSGSFTNPAGSPTSFLPADAGVGPHPLTYSIQSGDCINSIEDTITVVPAPTPIAIPDTICRNFGTVGFGRDGAFPYPIPSPSILYPNVTTTYTDQLHVMNVTGAGVVTGNTNAGSETFSYNPTAVTGNYDTLVIEYGFYRNEDTLNNVGVGVGFDTLEYVIARIVQPIYIEDLSPVNIVDTIVSSFYCQENVLHLLAGNPSNNTFGGGLFMLYGGTNQYQFGDTLSNNVINPYAVNNLENATTTYDLVYILNGAACRNSDTMSITISKGLNPTFATANGLDEFCDTDQDVAITHNVLAPDTAILKIGGIPQPSYVFSPGPLNPGIHVVELQMIDTFGCSASALDTFTIHALPSLSVSPGLNNQYCANDPVVDFVVSPSPGCPSYAAPGHSVLDENFAGGIPPSWNSTNVFAGKTWVGTTSLAQGGPTDGAAFIDTSQVLNDSWLISKSIDLVAGHRYRLTYMARAGALDSTCSGFCDAGLVVNIGSAATAPMGTQLDIQTAISNDLTYVRYVVEHYHDPALGFTTGQYYLGFRSVTPALGRSLRLDNVRMRDMTIGSCSLDGIGYVSGSGVHNEVDSAYQFNPLAGDPGNIEVKYVYTDIRGCQDSLVYPITLDTTPVVSFTNLDAFYCENEPTVMLTGSPLGGTFTSSMGTNLIHVPFYAPLDTAFFPVNYQTNTSGVDIVSYMYTDANGCSNTSMDTVIVVGMPDSNAINAAALDPQGNGHCAYDTLATLDVVAISGALITNGTFSGAGVRNGAGGVGVATFHPDSAVLDMGHTGDVTITYTYMVPPFSYGCVDTTRLVTRVHAAPDLSFVNLPDSLCLNRDSFQVQVQNNVVTGSMGQISYTTVLGAQSGTFTETSSNGTPLPNFIYLFDTLYPYLATGHDQVDISYTYIANSTFGDCYSTINDSIRIDSIPVAYFQNLQPSYCENDAMSIFLAFPPYNLGSGYLQIDTNQIDSSFYWIDPSLMVGAGPSTAVYPTYYTYTDSRGCTGEVFDTFEVRPYPRITFSPNYQDTFCRQVGLYDLRQALVGPLGGYFTDNLALTSIQDSFYLNLNSLAGPRLVTYHYVDPVTQCQNQDSIWIYLFSGPELDFNIYGGCAQMDITFDGSASNLVAGIDSITRIWWDFEGNGTITNSHLDTSEITIPDTTYQYTTNGTYNVTMYVQNQGSCVDSITKPLIISPYYDLATDYFEDFNAGPGDWYEDQPINVTPSQVWTHENSLSSSQINHSNGFWVTMAADTLYQKNQQAWVYSPCFDFSSSKRPMIAFDLWRDALDGIDGLVMEFYNNTTNKWELVGDVGEGINWYQANFVLAKPGAQDTLLNKGWTGRSYGFESARLRLDQFKRQRDIRFRLAFATAIPTVIDSTSGNGYEGMAFDNVWIGERTRNVLVEHFNNIEYTNVLGDSSDVIDQGVYNKIFNTNYGLDVVLIQYQIDDGLMVNDPIFATNTSDLGARKGYYSAAPNKVFIDGRTIDSGQSDSLNVWDLDYDMLQFPDFSIDIDTVITIVGQELTVEAKVEALVDKDSADYLIHAVVIQDSFTYANPNHPWFNMLSVARKMLPDNGGTHENHEWLAGDTVRIIESWDFSNQLGQAYFNETQLEVVVFIQNNDTEEIYQVATTQDLNRYTGTKKIEDEIATEIFNLNVYPNPSSHFFNVEFDKALEGEYTWRLIDVTGRVMDIGIAERGTRKFAIDAERLVDGAYFFVIHSEDNKTYAQRKLIVIK
ncbi:T9SS type A sorting domain-containing protein [Aureispira anguillae]|uniref:T9SS type A sorting domain-containing protein n=1 Tax=Aureispira anguillae TaxID=2864201 RepID=A0A916DTJ5_9BACT|nr:T9SS type A sorting domain-containing protein [Aureispira anguillae]BDS12606.1 T9SS type A sorting domain-containing protein [Aureispira anguillae]